jgi:hypothetical protein
MKNVINYPLEIVVRNSKSSLFSRPTALNKNCPAVRNQIDFYGLLKFLNRNA